MENPYPGLRPFKYEESYLFFGRQGQSEDLLRKLEKSHFVGVVGTSGSGKSSLVRAGLLPLLSSGFMPNTGSNWRVSVFRPGENPTHNLAEALINPGYSDEEKTDDDLKLGIAETILRRSAIGISDFINSEDLAPDENLLIVVDQFEEIFRFKKESKTAKPDEEAASFVKLLLEATKDKTGRVFVIITMRSDFLGDCAQFRNLPEAINEGQYLIPRLSREELRQVIQSPAKVYGASMELRLVTHLLNEIGDDQDQLPILQHVLMRTWDHWVKDGNPSREIVYEDYEATGGMKRALSLHADEAFAELTSEQQITCEKLFKSITEIDRENRETRRATTLSTICGVADVEIGDVVPIIDVFRKPGRTFLMPPHQVELSADSIIDISHESLIRKWNRLHDWVDEEAESAQTYRRLSEDSFLHSEGKAGFWDEPGLSNAIEWRDSFGPNASWADLYYKAWGTRSLSGFDETMTFLDESKTFRVEEIAEEERLRDREVKRLRKFVAAMGIMSFLLLGVAGVATVLYGVTSVQSRDLLTQEATLKEKAIENKKMAADNKVQKQSAADSQQKADENLAESKKQADRAQSQEAIALRKTREADALQIKADQALRSAQEQQARADTAQKDADVAQVKASEAQRTAAAANSDARLAQIKASDLEKKGNQLVYAANMLQASNLYREGQSDFLTRLNAGNEEAKGFEWNYLAALSRSDTESLVDFQGPQTFKDETLQYSPTGKYLITSGALVASTEGEIDNPNPEEGASLIVWDAGTGAMLKGLAHEASYYPMFAFSDDEAYFAVFPSSRAADSEQYLRVWETNGWKRRNYKHVSMSENEGILEISFTADGTELLMLTSRFELEQSSRFIRKWDTRDYSSIGEPIKLTGPDGEVDNLVVHGFFKDGRLIISHLTQKNKAGLSLFDSKTGIWERLIEHRLTSFGGETEETESHPDLPEYIYRISSDHDRVAMRHRIVGTSMFDFDETIYVLSTGANSKVLREFQGNEDFDLAPDGKHLAVTDLNSSTTIWNIENNQRLRSIPFQSRGFSLTFSPDSSLIATGGNDPRWLENHKLIVWAVSFERDRFDFERTRPRVVSASGNHLITWGGEDSLMLWSNLFGVIRKAKVRFSVEDKDEPVGLFSPGDKYLVATTSKETEFGTRFGDRSLRVWGMATGEEIELERDQACGPTDVNNRRGEWSLPDKTSFSSDGRLLANLCENGTVLVWNLSSKETERQFRLSDEIGEIIEDSRGIVMTFGMGNESLVFTRPWDNFRSTISISGNTESRYTVNDPTQAQVISNSPNGIWSVLQDSQDNFFLKERNGNAEYSLSGSNARQLAFSRDSKHAFVPGGSETAEIIVWNLETGAQARFPGFSEIKLNTFDTFDTSNKFKNFETSVNDRWLMAISGNSNLLAYWDIKANELKRFYGCALTPTISPDEKRLFTSCNDGSIWVFDLEIGQAMLSIKGNNQPLTKIVISPDNKRLLTLSKTGAKLFITDY